MYVEKNKSPKEFSAIMYAFIHGLVGLHLAGHSEEEKGLDNAEILIENFVRQMI